MNEQPNAHGPAADPSAETDLLALVKKIQQHLVFLEKKIDTLISHSQQKPAQEERFSRPFRPHHSSYRREQRGGYDDRPRDDRRSGGFDARRREGREGGFDKNRRFEKRHGDDDRGFRPKKKPFYFKNKNRG